jgi:hypothetical protein
MRILSAILWFMEMPKQRLRLTDILYLLGILRTLEREENERSFRRLFMFGGISFLSANAAIPS